MVDLAKYHSAATTMRNAFVGYQGGAYSRAGTAFVGFSKQTGRSFPPRLINFQFSILQGLALEFGNEYMRVISNGDFVTEPPIAITGATQSDPAVLTVTGSSPPYANGDWIFISGVAGMTQLNGQTYVVAGATATTVELTDVFGNPINSTVFGAYAGGGAAARIYTLATPYSEVDLPFLKWTQSADVMTICLVNQSTGTEYAPMNLERFADDDFVLAGLEIGASVQAPGSPSAISSHGAGSGTTHFQYVVTSISPVDGTESVASTIAELDNVTDIAATAGANQVVWFPVSTVNNYNVYKAAESQLPIPIGSQFGFAATVAGTSWNDTNIVPDFQQVPPLATNPFSQGAIIGADITAGGTGFTTINVTVNTATGTGAILLSVVSGGVVVDIIVQAAGQNYRPTDTISITGNGTGAAATLLVGPLTGTFPGVVSYYQQRRVFASSLNDPDTYFMSQPGNFNNFDARVPTIASDAITGSPWSVQVNGLQWLIPMPGGLVVLTGNQAWQLTGAGGSGLTPVAITPSDQQAQPQAFNGTSATVPPIQVDYDILFLDSVGSNAYDLAYQYWLNIYTGTDMTIYSTHLFAGMNIVEWAWARQPNKVVWAPRSDGAMLSLTYLKEQQIMGWARHDTQGLFVTVCSIIEPPVNAVYLGVQRFIGGDTVYMIERMDNRNWTAAENAWCVDAGLTLPHTFPPGTLFANSATGLGALTGVTDLVGGSGYSALTTATVVDDNGEGPGTGAVPTLTIAGGVITAVTFAAGQQGAGYTFPAIFFNDPSGLGSGASADAIVNNSAIFQTNGAAFSPGDVGSVIRTGGGIATVTAFDSDTVVTVNITSPITQVIPNSGWVLQTDSGAYVLVSTTPIPQLTGSWSMDVPVSTISNLNYLAGLTVTGVADGAVITPRVVSAGGEINLDTPATQVIVGLGFQVQIQSPYAPEVSVQGQRKRIARITARVAASRGLKMGANEPDASTLSPPRLVAQWNNLALAPDLGRPNYGSTIPPLFTGDIRIPVSGGFEKRGQAAVQQDNPLPLNLLAFVPEFDEGDLPEGGKGAAKAPEQQQSRSGPLWPGPAGRTSPPWMSA